MSLPIVLIHGIRVSSTMWSPTREHLDNPRKPPTCRDTAHGGASRTPWRPLATPWPPRSTASVGALVAGLSLGGYAALAAAEHLPERVAGVVAVGCTALPYELNVRPYRLLGKLESFKGEG